MNEIECTIAPNRDTLRPIMASAHFGLGDKSKWGYLGSRKAVVDDLTEGKSVRKVASDFGLKPSEVKDYILEYKLYLEALKLDWTEDERKILLNPAVAFNPPVRFFQSKGHLDAVGVSYDKANLKVDFADMLARQKFKHLIRKLVVEPEKGLGATASYDDVFKDFSPPATPKDEGAGDNATPSDGQQESNSSEGGSSGSAGDSNGGNSNDQDGKSSGGPNLKANALFNYPVKKHNGLLKQLMKEAKSINSKSHPAAATFLLRNILECITKLVVEEQHANPNQKQLTLATALDICLSNNVSLPADDKSILKQIKNNLSLII